MRLLIDALPVPKDERVLAGFDNAEDAAVYRLDDERALVFTTDFITPLVDDPELYGAIAAANSISDVAAMGAKPLMSLSVLGVPSGVPAEMVAQIVAGGARAALDAGAPLLGGHSVESRDMLFGLAVVGMAHPERLFKNDSLRVGDQLLLTKPLGTGALTTALRSGALAEDDLTEAFAGMTRSNVPAVDFLHRAEVKAATDITGFGLLGHAAELAGASGVQVAIEAATVPEYPRAREMLEQKHLTRGNSGNLRYAQSLGPVEGEPEPLLRDPQTSGGLLVAVARGREDSLLADLRQAGFTRAARIGEVRAGSGITIV